MTPTDLQCGILASGELGFTVLCAIHGRCAISFVCTDKASTEIVEFSRANSIPIYVGNPRSGRATEALNGLTCDVLLSVNYLFLVEEDVIRLAKKAAINFHGSLLPKYRGRTPHVWAIINGETETGITAHRMVSQCDAGDILLQRTISLSESDTGAAVLAKYREIYPEMIDEVFHLLCNEPQFRTQNANEATWFGKRTPEDGAIDWNWQWRRIRNWVRAQTPPYPGAFTHCKGERLHVDWVERSDVGYRCDDPNGLVLRVTDTAFFVKTPNAVLAVTQFRDPNKALHEGAVFS